jgi:hypothetical protein
VFTCTFWGFGLIRRSLVQDKSQIVYVTYIPFPSVGGSRRREQTHRLWPHSLDRIKWTACSYDNSFYYQWPYLFPLSLAFQRLQLGDSCATTAGTWETEINGTSACIHLAHNALSSCRSVVCSTAVNLFEESRPNTSVAMHIFSCQLAAL